MVCGSGGSGGGGGARWQRQWRSVRLATSELAFSIKSDSEKLCKHSTVHGSPVRRHAAAPGPALRRSRATSQFVAPGGLRGPRPF